MNKVVIMKGLFEVIEVNKGSGTCTSSRNGAVLAWVENIEFGDCRSNLLVN